jgi:hypothetical protein
LLDELSDDAVFVDFLEELLVSDALSNGLGVLLVSAGVDVVCTENRFEDFLFIEERPKEFSREVVILPFL